jgi:hypothetical protein
MKQSYNSFVDLGMITPPTSPTTTPAASVGYMYNSDGSMTQVSAVTQITTPLGAI